MKQLLRLLFVLCFLQYNSLSAQNIDPNQLPENLTVKGAVFTIKGKVVSSGDGEPVPGAIVQLKGSPNKVTTDTEGNYRIQITKNPFNLSKDDEALLFSQPGFKPAEVAIKGRGKVDAEMISETEVTEMNMILTGTADGRTMDNLCFSVGCLQDQEVTNAYTDYIGLGLQGKVPGLRVNQVGGQPGQGAYLQMRSANSIANGQQPLIIVDGIYLNGSTLADISPEDIEKVEVLKGSAASSLYGSQAANGVIQIFTKNGQGLKVGETKVTYRGEFGYSEETNRYNINQYTNKEVVDPTGPQPILGNPTAEDIYNTELPNFQDYQEDILFQRGAFQSNYLSVTGRTNSTNFLLSMQRLRDEGIIQTNDGYTRNSFRLNLGHQLSEKFDVNVSSMFASSRQDLLSASSGATGTFLGNALALTPIFGLEAPNEEDGSAYDWDIDNTGNGVTNPLYLAENTDQQVNRTRLLGTIGTNYYANDWLTFSYAATLDRSTNDYEHFINKGFLSTDIPGLFGNLASANAQNSSGGGIHRTQRVNEYLTSRFDATVKKKLGGLNTILRGSYLYEDQQVVFNESIGENLAVEDIRSLDNAQSNVFIASEKQDIIGHSGFLIADVDYKKKYLFSGLFRREGSSLFGPEKRWHNYYRVSGAYRVTEDINLKIFQELKLRASIGTAGIRPNFSQRFETFNLINGTTTRNTLGNEFLRPATSNEMEIGANGTLFKAFDFEVNYVKNTTEDQIILVPLSGAAGFSGQWRNAGTLEATIYEASVNTDFAKLFKIKNSDFHWDLNVIFDRVEQTITRLDIPAYNTGPGIEQSSLFLIEEGIPFGTMVGEVFATSVEQLADQEFVNPADYTINEAGYVVRVDQLGTPDEKPYKLVDANGNPLVQTIGDINPDFRMGFANTIEYKGFRLFALVDWKKGGDVYNQSKQYLYGLERHSDLGTYDIAAGFYGSDGLQNGLVANNHFVEDGSFIMLREATFSYTLNRGLFGKLIDNMQFSLIGRNLFTITDYSGFHPDVTSVPRDENTLTNRVQGNRGSEVTTPNGDPSLFYVDAFNYPVRKTFTFRIQATF